MGTVGIQAQVTPDTLKEMCRNVIKKKLAFSSVVDTLQLPATLKEYLKDDEESSDYRPRVVGLEWQAHQAPATTPGDISNVEYSVQKTCSYNNLETIHYVTKTPLYS